LGWSTGAESRAGLPGLKPPRPGLQAQFLLFPSPLLGEKQGPRGEDRELTAALTPLLNEIRPPTLPLGRVSAGPAQTHPYLSFLANFYPEEERKSPHLPQGL